MMEGTANIRSLIQAQMSEDDAITGMLAKYNGHPALFYQSAPSDARSGWEEPRYPRIDFSVDMRQDYERKTSGTLTVNIWATTECAAIGELDPDRAIEARLQELIDGTFYSGTDGTCCVEWGRSDEFRMNTEYGQKHPEVYGLTVTFELLAFPEQITTDPDPVLGLNMWTRRHFADAALIAYDDMPPVWKPTDEHPAVYWRFEEASTDRESYAVTWYNGNFACHVIAETVPERNRWVKAIMERLQHDGEVLLPDESPMFVKGLRFRSGSDALRDGQIELTGMYGVLEQPKKDLAKWKLNHAHYQEGGNNKWMQLNTRLPNWREVQETSLGQRRRQ